MANEDLEFKKLKQSLDKNYKDLTTKYNVLVKRTNSIITSLSEINQKLDYLVETMSMFELVEDDSEDFNPYNVEEEEYEDMEDDEDDDSLGKGYD